MVWALTAHLPVFERRSGPQLQASTTAAVERGFAATIAERVQGGVLPQSDRQALLRAADRLHIERFRANLLIALIQREVSFATTGQRLPPPAGSASWTVPQPPIRERQPYRRTLAWTGALLCLEAVVGLGAYWFSFH